MTGNKIKLLIVDDERDLVDVLVLRLKTTKMFSIKTAYDGQTGLDAANAFKPDVVLLDTYMPDLNGDEVCRRLRSNDDTKNAAIIIMTAGYTQKLESDVRKAGANALIRKPFETTALVSMLKGGSHLVPETRQETPM